MFNSLSLSSSDEHVVVIGSIVEGEGELFLYVRKEQHLRRERISVL